MKLWASHSQPHRVWWMTHLGCSLPTCTLSVSSRISSAEPLTDGVWFEPLYLVFLTWALLHFLILLCCREWWFSLIGHFQNLKGPEDELLTPGLSVCKRLTSRQGSLPCLSAFRFDSLYLSLFYFIQTSSVSSFAISSKALIFSGTKQNSDTLQSKL